MAQILNFKRYEISVPEFDGFTFLGYQQAYSNQYVFNCSADNPELTQVSENPSTCLYFVYEKNPEPLVTIKTSGKAYSIPQIKKLLPRQILLEKMTLGYPSYSHCLRRTSTKTYFQPGCINDVEINYYDCAYILQE
jgi:hypothetical protein